MKKIDRPATFLEDNGVLFEINRQVLHPLGMELHFTHDSEGRANGLELLDNRETPQPIYFSPEAFESGRDRYQGYMETDGKRNMQKRHMIGLTVQTGPNSPRSIVSAEEE